MNILVIIGCYNLEILPTNVRQTLDSWVLQKTNATIDVVIISTICSNSFIRDVTNEYVNQSHPGDLKFHILEIKDNHPIYVSLNIAWTKFCQHKRYDYFICSHEDIHMTDSNALDLIIDTFADPNIGTVLGWCNYRNAPNSETIVHKRVFYRCCGEPYILHPTQTPAFNFVVFSRAVFESYGFKFIDIMRHGGPDAYVILLNLLVHKKCVYNTKTLLTHAKSKKNKINNVKYGHQGLSMFDTDLSSLVKNGRKFGFYHVGRLEGYESFKYDPELINYKRLFEWVKKNLFLNNEQFNYHNYECNIISGQ